MSTKSFHARLFASVLALGLFEYSTGGDANVCRI